MKKILFTNLVITFALGIYGQTNNYPMPEFNNEVYWLRKDSSKVVRLEKNSSKMDTKVNMVSGSENSYTLDGERSSVRLNSGSRLSFIYTTGNVSSSPNHSADSTMRVNGIDPNMMQGFSGGVTDPSNSITLYKLNEEKGNRKIILMKVGGVLSFSNHKQRSSDKYSFSVKKIKEGYWELLVDKTLPKGEYAFSVSAMSMTNMDGSITVFAFAID